MPGPHDTGDVGQIPSRRDTRSQFVKVPAWVAFGDLSDGAIRCYMVLADESFRHQGEPFSMSYSILGRNLHLSARQAMRLVVELGKFGAIKVTKTLGVPNEYEIPTHDKSGTGSDQGTGDISGDGPVTSVSKTGDKSVTHTSFKKRKKEEAADVASLRPLEGVLDDAPEGPPLIDGQSIDEAIRRSHEAQQDAAKAKPL